MPEQPQPSPPAAGRVIQRAWRYGLAEAAPPPTGAMAQRLPAVTGALVAGAGLLVLLGWLFGVTSLKSIMAWMPSMKANTGLCFLLAGVALVCRHRQALRWACAGSVCVVAGLTLAEYLTGGDFGIDQLLFHDTLNQHTIYPGRMVIATAFGLVMSGAALLLLNMRHGRWAQQLLAVGVGVIGLVGVLGYLYDIRTLYQFAGASSMALHTAAAFVVLAVGLVVAHPDGLAGVLTVPGPGTQMARQFLVIVVLLPVIIGWVHVTGERTGIWGPAVGAGLFALMMILALLAVGWWIARTLNHADAVRREIEAQLLNLGELMDHAHEPLIVSEPGGIIRAWNRGAEALYGWPAVEALGRRKHELLRTAGHAVAEIDRQLTGAGRWEGELIHTTRDGRQVIVESSQTASRIGDGQAFILDSNRDITEHKRAETALRQSEERYRLLFNTMFEGFCIIEVLFDAERRPVDYRFLEVNPAFAAQTGLRKAQGRRMRELAPELEAYWFEIYGKVALTGEPVHFMNEAKALQRWFEISAYRVDEPEIHKVAILFNDITESKRAEEAMRLSVETFEKTFQGNAAAIVLSLAENGQILDANDRWLVQTGFSRAEVIGKTTVELKVWHDDGIRATIIREIEQYGAVRDFECACRHKDGHEWLALLSAQVVTIRGERVLISSAIDITERKGMEEELRRSRVAALNLMQDAVEARQQAEQANTALAASMKELRAHSDELARFNRVAVGRELRIVDLKKEVNELRLQAGQAARYPLAFEQ